MGNLLYQSKALSRSYRHSVETGSPFHKALLIGDTRFTNGRRNGNAKEIVKLLPSVHAFFHHALGNRCIHVTERFTIEDASVATLVALTAVLSGCIDITALEVLVREAITVIVDVVAGLGTRFWRLTEPSQCSITDSRSITVPESIGVGAGLRGR